MRRVCDALAKDARSSLLRVIHVVLDDGSKQGVSDYKALERAYSRVTPSTPYQVVMLRNPQNNGVRGFWRTLNTLFAYAKSTHYQYVISMPDDCMPCDRFFERVTAHFERLREEDPRIVAMNIGCCMLRNWGTCRFVDEAYIATRQLFEALNFELESIGKMGSKWTDNFRCGSGTGNQMTQRMLKCKEYRIAPCQDVSYLNPVVVPSVMFNRGKKERVWWRQNCVGDGGK